MLTCCSAFDWFGRNFYPLKEGKIDYGAINGELEELEGKVSSVLVLPYFQGRSTPDWNPGAKAHFGDISLASGRGELVKGLLEGFFWRFAIIFCCLGIMPASAKLISAEG